MPLQHMQCATCKQCNVRADCRLAELVQPSLATLASACWIALQMHFVQAGERSRPLISAVHRQLTTDSAICWGLAFAGHIQHLQDVFSICRTYSAFAGQIQHLQDVFSICRTYSAFAGHIQHLQGVFRHTLRMLVMSEPLRTKDAAMKSMSLISPHWTKSSSSFFVNVGRSTMTPGRLTFLRSLHAMNHVRHKIMKWQADNLALFAWLDCVIKVH